MVIGKENIPTNGPLILAVTHPNAFLDDVLIGLHMKKGIFYLARGDVFKKPIARFFLKAMHVYPIIRPRDGKNEVRKNLALIEKYKKMLLKEKVILIHPEGLCVNEKNVRPLRKGLAKMALGAEDDNNWNMHLNILPIGLNYNNAPYSREDVTICIGKAIKAHTYKDEFKENEAKAYKKLTDNVFTVLNKLSITQKQGTEDVSDFCINERKANFANLIKNPSQIDYNELFEQEKLVSEKINSIHGSDTFKKLENNINTLKELQKGSNISQSNLVQHKKTTLYTILHSLGYYLGSLLFFFPQFWLPRICEKMIKSIEFRASIFIGLLFILGLISCSIWLIVSLVIFGPLGFLILIILFLSAIGFARYWDHLSFTKGEKDLLELKKNRPNKYQDILSTYKETLNIINSL